MEGMKAFIDGGFLFATIVVLIGVAIISLLATIPFIIKRQFADAKFYFLVIAIPLMATLAAPMLMIIFDKEFVQGGWVLYFFLIPAAALYYLIMFIFCTNKAFKY